MAISNIEPLGYSIDDATRLVGVGRTTIYALAKENRLEIVKLRGRSIVTAKSLRKLVGG
jgi:excisionase family DNA binding protein